MKKVHTKAQELFRSKKIPYEILPEGKFKKSKSSKIIQHLNHSGKSLQKFKLLKSRANEDEIFTTW